MDEEKVQKISRTEERKRKKKEQKFTKTIDYKIPLHFIRIFVSLITCQNPTHHFMFNSILSFQLNSWKSKYSFPMFS